MLRRLCVVSALTTALALPLGCDSKPKESDAGKASKKAADAKVGDAKAGDAKAGDAKAGDTKAGDTKAGDTKAGDGGTNVANLSDADLEKLRKDAAKVREHLTEARAKLAAEDWAAASDAYQKAVALDDDNPKILAELGWAQFNAKDLQGADHSFHQALRYEQDKEARADVLYKLGRLDEENGDFDEAKKHYEMSLELKENPEAKAHAGDVAKKAAAACADGKCEKPDYPDLKAACEAMVARVHAQQGLEPHSADGEFSCDHEKASKVPLKGGDATEAAILVVKGAHAGTEEEEHDLLVHIEGGWHWVGTLLDLENPHRGGIERSGKIISLEAKEALPKSAGEEILVKLEFKESDADLDDNTIYHDEHEAYVVCGINQGTHVCYEIPTRMSYKAEALDPKVKTAYELTSHEFVANAQFDGKGNVTVSGKGEVPEAEKGMHAIADLPEPEGFVFLHEE